MNSPVECPQNIPPFARVEHFEGDFFLHPNNYAPSAKTTGLRSKNLRRGLSCLGVRARTRATRLQPTRRFCGPRAQGPWWWAYAKEWNTSMDVTCIGSQKHHTIFPREVPGLAPPLGAVLVNQHLSCWMQINNITILLHVSGFTNWNNVWERQCPPIFTRRIYKLKVWKIVGRSGFSNLLNIPTFSSQFFWLSEKLKRELQFAFIIFSPIQNYLKRNEASSCVPWNCKSENLGRLGDESFWRYVSQS